MRITAAALRGLALVVFFAVVSAGPADAGTLTWTLNETTLWDGTAITGQFDYDSAMGLISNYSFTVMDPYYGECGIYGCDVVSYYTYDSSTVNNMYTGSWSSNPDIAWIYFDLYHFDSDNYPDHEFYLAFTSSLDQPGIAYLANSSYGSTASSGEWRWYPDIYSNTGEYLTKYRLVDFGYAEADGSVPEPASILLTGGAGLITALARRRFAKPRS